MKDLKTNMLVRTAIIAAVYALSTIGIMPLSFGPIQFRVSELLVLLAFIDKGYIPGLVLGCVIANFFSPFGLIDVIFGSIATFLSVYMISKSKNLFIATLYPVIFNGIIVGIELKILENLPLVLTSLQVAFGEFVVVTLVGYPVFKYLIKSENIKDKLIMQKDLL